MEWISVKDRMPNEHQVVLCFGFSGEDDLDLCHKDYDLGQIDNIAGLQMFGLSNGTATHWMPLPEPPK